MGVKEANNRQKHILRLKDYKPQTIHGKTDIENLRLIANHSLKNLSKEWGSELIVFPRNFEKLTYEDEEKTIISMVEAKDSATITPSDMLGFIGVNNTYLSIGTRFTSSGKDKEDYLLHYMLEKVFQMKILSVLHPSSEDGMLETMVHMFPGFLAKALRQGLLKKYTRFQRNDANIKGPIDVSRHIRTNTPFNGKIAYTHREHATDNAVTQLIRHTIEFIRDSRDKFILTTDSQIRENVGLIINTTPSYDIKKRHLIITANKKRNPHPYYTAYEPLVRLCIAILEHHKIRYHADKNNIFGILFSGSWLWEEYLYKSVFKELNFLHPDNRKKTNPIHVFYGTITESKNDEEVLEKNYAPRYPDFILAKDKKKFEESQECQIVVDAKYRHYSYCGDRDNLHQIITYMYITKAQSGVLIYPIGTDTDVNKIKELKEEIRQPKIINGGAGKYFRIGFEIPEETKSYQDFSDKMRKEEKKVIEELSNIS